MIWLMGGAVTLAVAGFWLMPRLGRLDFSGPVADADMPCAFGYKMSWLAVKTRDTARLIETLRLEDARAANWSVGVATAYNERLGLSRVFITPPVDGWSFVVGLSLPHPMADGYDDKCLPLLEALSREFGVAQYYISYPDLEFFGWAAFRDGELQRAFACGQEGVIWNRGSVTTQERGAGIELFNLREVGRRAEDAASEQRYRLREADVLRLARLWSLDPTRLDARDDLGLSVGYVAAAPLGWRGTPTAARAA